jgi:hypothetical protein
MGAFQHFGDRRSPSAPPRRLRSLLLTKRQKRDEPEQIRRSPALVDSIDYPALASAAVILVKHVDNKSVVLTAQKIHCTIGLAIDIEGVISKRTKAPSYHVIICWICIQSHSSYVIFVSGEVPIIETIDDLRSITGEVIDVRPFLTLIGVRIAIGQVHADPTSVWITT